MADFVPLTLRNTKRYARLVAGNVRNSKKVKQVSVIAYAYAWADYYVCFTR